MTITGILLDIAAAVILAVPSWIAQKRRCEDISLICLLSVFLGWTVIGWIGALLWAIYGKTKPVPSSELPRV